LHFFAINLHVRFAFFCERFDVWSGFALLICIFLHFQFFLHFGSASKDSFLHFFKLEACLGNEGHFFGCIFFCKFAISGQNLLGKLEKYKKTLGYVQQKCKNEQKMQNKRKQ